jgi:hypothetical protein
MLLVLGRGLAACRAMVESKIKKKEKKGKFGYFARFFFNGTMGVGLSCVVRPRFA